MSALPLLSDNGQTGPTAAGELELGRGIPDRSTLPLSELQDIIQWLIGIVTRYLRYRCVDFLRRWIQT